MSKILLSRYNSIEENEDSAIKRLNTYEFKKGEPVTVAYKILGQEEKVDTLFAIGIKEGKGHDCYRIVTAKEEIFVSATLLGKENEDGTISVVGAVGGSQYLVLAKHYNNDNRFKYFLYKEIEGKGVYSSLENDTIYRDLATNFRWFYSNNILKREDDFLTRDEIQKEIDRSLYETINPTIRLNLLNKDLDTFCIDPKDTNFTTPIFDVTVIDCKGNNITENCSNFSLSYYNPSYKDTIFSCKSGDYDSNFSEIETSVTLINGIARLQEITETIQTKTTWFKLTLTTEFNKVFSIYSFQTLNSNLEINIDIDIDVSVENKLSSTVSIPLPQEAETAKIEFPSEALNLTKLNNSRISIFIPNDLGKNIYHIYDVHGLDYLVDDYEKTILDSGIKYTKKTPVTMEKFIQILVFKQD